MLCYVMLCYVMLCYVMLCYVMLCYVMLLKIYLKNTLFKTALLFIVKLKLAGGGRNVEHTVLETRGAWLSGLGRGFGNCGGGLLMCRVERENFP